MSTEMSPAAMPSGQAAHCQLGGNCSFEHNKAAVGDFRWKSCWLLPVSCRRSTNTCCCGLLLSVLKYQEPQEPVVSPHPKNADWCWILRESFFECWWFFYKSPKHYRQLLNIFPTALHFFWIQSLGGMLQRYFFALVCDSYPSSQGCISR